MSPQHIFKGIKFSLQQILLNLIYGYDVFPLIPRLASIAIFMCVILQLPKEISATNQPSLELIPTPPEDQSEKNLINLRRNSNGTMWGDRIAETLKHYYNPALLAQGQNRIFQCTDDQSPPQGFICEVDMRLFDGCNRENYFGYQKKSPCVFLKIKSPPGWIPEFYNSTADLPQDMPSEIRSEINDAITSKNLFKLQRLWVSCDGDWAADKEFIGPVEYYPERGYPGYYFPMDESNDLSPLVAIQFRRAAIGVIIYIECRLWAKNIEYDQKKQLGSTSFKLLID